jgi:hypothetical protein
MHAQEEQDPLQQYDGVCVQQNHSVDGHEVMKHDV